MATFRGLFVRKDSTRGVQPAEARLALAGLLTPSGDVAALPGVISGLTVRGVAGQWYYAIDGGHSTTVRAATDGANLPGLDGVTNTPATADNGGASLVAPGSGSRWDLIWIRQRDVDNADADSASVLGVTAGTASGSPSKPYGSVPAGALVLAEAQVGAGATGTLHANVVITQVAPKVGLRGAILRVRNAAERALTIATASATNPIFTRRDDAPTGTAMELSLDGSTVLTVPVMSTVFDGTPLVGTYSGQAITRKYIAKGLSPDANGDTIILTPSDYGSGGILTAHLNAQSTFDINFAFRMSSGNLLARSLNTAGAAVTASYGALGFVDYWKV